MIHRAQNTLVTNK